jgi:hypothetical protein
MMDSELKINDIYLDDNESESDVQDQQPTEATDDSKHHFNE